MSDTAWVITETEMRENDIQFSSLNPVNGFVSGEQARPLFMKSGLSPAILAQVWHLADYSKDGKMDRFEFSIAMHLIRAVLAGAALPPTLPVSLKPPMVMTPSYPPLIAQTPMVRPVMTYGGVPPTTTPNLMASGKIQGDWTIPHHNKLKYCQQFNQLDKSRIGSLSGVHARNILAQSQLPNSVLAEIWNLSDYNKDGRLSVEEFCVAMHLIDSVKAGYLLPKTLPPELATHCSRSVSDSPVLDPNAPPAQKIQIPKTFEDKRRDNYDRGQAELDRRRQALREEEERRRAEFEKKEKEMAEKREREREEAERKRQAEREAELEREQKREEARLAEERRILAEKEEARKEMERQRKADLNAIRIREIKAQRQNEVDMTLERQQRQKSLSFQLQALDEKSTDLNANITQARDQIVGITKEIEAMKVKRDEKAERIRSLELTKQQQKLSVQYERLAHESLQMQVECRNRAQKLEDLEQAKNTKQSLIAHLSALNKQLKDANERAKVQQQLVTKKAEELNQCTLKLTQLSTLHSQLYEQIKSLKPKVTTIVSGQNGEVPNVMPTSLSNHSINKSPSVDLKSVTNGVVQQFSVPNNTLPKGNGATGAVKYRALYEFTARSDDELSFQPGDVILAFENHAAEPGWLAGQMRDKVGWFPVAFAEPMIPVSVVPTQPPQTVSSVTTSPSSEPLQSIVEEPVASVVKSTSGSFSVVPSEQEKQLPVLGAAVALYQWKARNDNELSFSKGDVIEILEQLEMRWKGRNKSGAIGWFPKSYVSMSSGDAKPDLKDNLTKDQVEKSKESIVKDTSVPSSTPSSGAVYDVVTAETPTESTSGEWYVALYDFQAMEPTDLDLHAGDRIFVTEAVNEWWKGTCNGRVGIFPANYVQKCPSSSSDISQSDDKDLGTGKAIADFEASAENQLSLKVGDVVKIQSKSSSGWWQGEIVSDNGAKKSGWFPGNYVEILSGNELKAEALYDYQAQRDDELSFKAGDIIIVTDQSDGEWWKGRLINEKNAPDALFPGNYVQLRNTTQPNIEASVNSVTLLHNPAVTIDDQYSTIGSKCKKLSQELLDTEVKYCHDLKQCYEVFAQGLRSIISANLANQLFLNFEQLILTSTSIANALKQSPPGDVFVERIDLLRAYVEFCSKQQAALEMLNELEHNNVAFRQAYRSCCMKTKGINFSYFLLLPMNRITRYPLIFEKLVKYTESDDPKRKNLEKAYEMLKSLCTEINNVISAMDSSSMLIWAQQHIHCEAIQPPIVFPSSTRKVGPRCLLHSGALQKQLNGKILVALLFNDFLMLTTPVVPIEQLEEFRISKTSELQLNLYKTPLLLENAKVMQNKEMDDCSFEVRSGEFSVILRAPNRNARLFWIAQIEKAISDYHNQCLVVKKSSLSCDISEQGRLFVELVCILNVDSALKLLGTQSILCKFQIGQSSTYADVDINKKEHLCTTQLPIYKTAYDDFFEVAIFLNRIFSPDLCAGSSRIAMADLLTAATMHRGPMSKQFDCESGDISNLRPRVILKFVVQLFY